VSETREWTKGSPKAIGPYAIEFADGSVDLASAYGDAGHIYVSSLVRSSNMSGEITRHYGPLTTEELLSGIPKPPPRLPKAHPDRYTAQIAHRIGLGDVVITHPAPDHGEVECQLLDNPSVRDSMSLSILHIFPNRFAQQDTDGVWREVSV
jgi:hypothetical protein